VATCVISATATNMIPASDETSRTESERSLVQRAQNGDEQAFATLFQTHKKRVYSVCLLMTKDIADAEDLTQEAFLQVFRSVSSFRGDSAFSTWLYRVAVNTVLMKLRRRKSPPIVSLDEPVSSESPSLRRDVGESGPAPQRCDRPYYLAPRHAGTPRGVPADFRPSRGSRISAS
jgi:hypothetical protein